ncbi:MAG: hypothetical protein ACK55I_34750, partial [bacterium]
MWALPYCRSLRGALSYSYNSSSFRHLFQMRHQRRDVGQGDLVQQIRRLGVRHLVEIDKDLNLVDVNLVHLVQEQIGRGVLFRVDQFFDQVAVVVQQNRDELNRVLVLTLAGVVRQALQVLVDVDHLKF